MAIITISRGTKSGGLKLAEHLAGRLGYVIKSREVIIEGARKYNIMEDELLHLIEDTPTFWQRLTREHRRNLCFIQCALVDAVRQDNVIYHGYAGQLFLRDIQHVLKVRLEAPFEERVSAIMQEQQLGYEDARDYLEKMDGQRVRWVKTLYDEELRDPALYDISFNTSNLSIDTIVEIIAMTVQRDQFSTTEQSLGKLNDLSLTCEVKAALASDDKLWSIPIVVSADHGVVTLRGQVKDNSVREELNLLVNQVKGVQGCQLNLGLVTAPLSKGIYGHD